MPHLLFLLLPLFANAESSFITQEEYSTQLYHSPRGIGCHLCHGERGEGKIIAKYKHKNHLKDFKGSAINKLSYSEFYAALTQRHRGMPRYFLIEDEIKALYYYLEQKNKPKKKKKKHAKR